MAATVKGPRGTGSGGPLTAEQRSFLDTYGYLALPGLFADDVDQLVTAFDLVFADAANPRLEYDIVGHRFHPHRTMGHFVELDPRLAAVAVDHRIVSVARAVLGPLATFVGSDGSIFACETEWHYDTPIDHREERHLKFAFYLDPLDGTAGAPRVLPLSHLDPARYDDLLQPYLGFDGAIEARTGLPGEDLPAWQLETRPGDVLVWDYRLMHASYGSTASRRQFTVNFRAGAPGT